MGKITTGILVLIFCTFIQCGNQDNSPPQADKMQSNASVPKIDLHTAIIMDNLEVIKQHIKVGSDLNIPEPTRASTPLITAAALDKSEATKILIDAGADMNYQNIDGSTALHTAVAFGNTDIARILIDSGIDLNIKNKEGSTALHTAAFLCRVDIVSALLEKGADKNLKNKAGKSAFEIVETPFEKVKSIYDAVGAGLKPLGIKLEYEYIKKYRPIIAEMLK
jgi:ankyrin repeat protein